MMHIMILLSAWDKQFHDLCFKKGLIPADQRAVQISNAYFSVERKLLGHHGESVTSF
jgi:hypothetical protein